MDTLQGGTTVDALLLVGKLENVQSFSCPKLLKNTRQSSVVDYV